MKFGEKLKEQRKKRKLSQVDLAKAIGVGRTTIINYENGKSHPQDRTAYYDLAAFFGLDVNYFLTEDEHFLTAVAELYGKDSQNQAKLILEQTSALLAGGSLSDTDKSAFTQEMQAIFLDSMKRLGKLDG